MFGFANAISCATLTARGQCGHVGVVNTRTVTGVSTAAMSARLSADSVDGAPADEQHRLNERHELVAGRRAEKADLRIALGAGLVLADDGNRRHAIDAVLRGLVGLEDEVDFFDRDLVGQRRQLVENLPRLQAGLAAERLREEQQTHRAVHLRETSRASFA